MNKSLLPLTLPLTTLGLSPGAAALAAPNAAVPQSSSAPIVRVPLLTATLPNDKAVSRVEVKRIEFSPLQQTGEHLHPVPVVGLIEKGTISFQLDGEPARTLHAGDAFYEPPGRRVLRFDNASSTEKASFVAFYLLGTKDTDLIRPLVSPAPTPAARP